MERAAIVTGASSGIGCSISRMLVLKGYVVFGIGRNFMREEYHIDSSLFHAVECDITDTDRLIKHVKDIMADYEVELLVNNAGVGYYGLHEEINANAIKEMVRVNLEAPMILTQVLLRTLKRNSGYIINISSVTAQKSNPHGCAYGATKAGLRSFAHSLFDEARKYGVKVINIEPDMTKTNLYRKASFCQGEEEESYLMPEEVADAVRYAIEARDGMVISDITLKPQIHRLGKPVYNENKKSRG